MNFSRFREASLLFTNLAKPVTQRSFEMLKFLLTFLPISDTLGFELIDAIRR